MAHAVNSRVLTNRQRLAIVMLILCALFIVMIARVAYWGVVRGPELQEEAEAQWISDTVIRAQRGSILDRNGNVLAQSAGADTVVLLPQQVKDPQKVASELSAVLDLDAQELLQTASTKTRIDANGSERKIYEVWVKRQITAEESEAISRLELPGVSLISDVRRYYPNKSTASQIIGYTSADGDGQTGIERRFNSVLEGRQGRAIAETDRLGDDIPNGEEMTIAPVDGENVTLTIDELVQSSVESVCTEAQQTTGSDSVQALVMDIRSREILALANVPGFDLNNPPRTDTELLASQSSNVVLGRAYEPGVLFTVFTAAAARDAGIAKASYDCHGAAVIDGAEINCTETHGVQTFDEAVANGCVVAAAEMASDMGRERFYAYLESFGFGEKTGIELPSENAGSVLEMKYASQAEIARMGGGQSVKLTQIQFASALASLLDEGKMKTPQIVLMLQDPNGARETQNFATQVTGTSVGEATAQQIAHILGSAGSESSGQYAAGILSGTVLQPREGVESPVSSAVTMCAAFAPVRAPKYLVLVTLNSENQEAIGAGQAERYARTILEDVLRYMDIEPEAASAAPSASASPTATGSVSPTVHVPKIVGMDFEEAKETLEEEGLVWEADGTGTVRGQRPYAGELVQRGSTVRLEMSDKTESGQPTQAPAEGGLGANQTVVPDFRGMTFTQAMRACSQAGLTFLAQGTGKAVTQTPVAGAHVERGTSVTVTFRIDLE